MRGVVLYQQKIFREDLKNNPNQIYVFGDNMMRCGLGGQAREMRFEPNAIGIPTKWRPSMDGDAFFTDDDFDKVVPTIEREFEKLTEAIVSGKNIVIPKDGIGTGLSQLPKRAPKIFKYIEDGIRKLES